MSIIELMSSKRERVGNKSPTASPPDITYTDPVICQWDTCMEQFSCITDLVQHIEKTHMLKGFMKGNVCLWKNCLRNREPFKDRYRLVIHLRIHTREKSHRCPYPGCDKILANLVNLKIHLRRHTGEMSHRCRIEGCDRSFVNSTECSRHEKTHFEQLSKTGVQGTPLIATPPEQHPYRPKTENGFYQLPFPMLMIGLPDINTIFDQDLANNSSNNLTYTDLQSQAYSSYYSPQMADFSQHIPNPKSLVIPSLSSVTSTTNIHSHPQSIYKQYIPSHLLPSYEDIQYKCYKSPLTTTQQPIMSHQQDYLAIPASSMSD